MQVGLGNKGKKNTDTAVMVTPNAGFVIKSYVEDGKKVFINVCYADEIEGPTLYDAPAPLETEGEESNERGIVPHNETDAPPPFRIPLSLSEMREDEDASGNKSSVWDACVGTDTLKRALDDASFRDFLVELCLQWVESKSSLLLSRDVKLPKLRAKGTLVQHRVRKRKEAAIKPVDHERLDAKGKLKQSALREAISHLVPQSTAGIRPQRNEGTKRSSTPKEPSYEIRVNDNRRYSAHVRLEEIQRLQIEVQLPRVDRPAEVEADVSDDTLELTYRQIYALTLPLPCPVDVDSVTAEFLRESQVLRLSMLSKREAERMEEEAEKARQERGETEAREEAAETTDNVVRVVTKKEVLSFEGATLGGEAVFELL